MLNIFMSQISLNRSGVMSSTCQIKPTGDRATYADERLKTTQMLTATGLWNFYLMAA
jgi:hypothetical protein